MGIIQHLCKYTVEYLLGEESDTDSDTEERSMAHFPDCEYAIFFSHILLYNLCLLVVKGNASSTQPGQNLSFTYK